MENGTIVVKLNNTMRNYFLSHRGVRQGVPLSPLLFNFGADVLTRMVASVQQNSLVNGLAENLVDNGVAILLFEQMSGLKINFDKSEIVLVGGDNHLAI
jgi:hypothetical protein